MAEAKTYAKVDVQQLATLFAVLAIGATHNLELSPDDLVAEEYCESARSCLVKGNFMTHSTLAGVQTLVSCPGPIRRDEKLMRQSLMAHYQLQTDRGRDGDSAWPLWGLAMRIAQAVRLVHIRADLIDGPTSGWREVESSRRGGRGPPTSILGMSLGGAVSGEFAHLLKREEG